MKVINFVRKILKICAYIPVLWKDEDWDYSYLLDLIKFKLNRMRDRIHKDNIIVPSECRDICIGINQTIDHINNYLDGMDAFERINGALPFKTGFRTEKLANGGYSMITWNEDANRRLNDEEEELYTQHIKNSWAFEQKEWELIFDTIKKEGQKWWD